MRQKGGDTVTYTRGMYIRFDDTYSFTRVNEWMEDSDSDILPHRPCYVNSTCCLSGGTRSSPVFFQFLTTKKVPLNIEIYWTNKD